MTPDEERANDALNALNALHAKVREGERGRPMTPDDGTETFRKLFALMEEFKIRVLQYQSPSGPVSIARERTVRAANPGQPVEEPPKQQPPERREDGLTAEEQQAAYNVQSGLL